MQHDDQRDRLPGVAAGDEQLVRAASRLVAEGPGEELRAGRRLGLRRRPRVPRKAARKETAEPVAGTVQQARRKMRGNQPSHVRRDEAQPVRARRAQSRLWIDLSRRPVDRGRPAEGCVLRKAREGFRHRSKLSIWDPVRHPLFGAAAAPSTNSCSARPWRAAPIACGPEWPSAPRDWHAKPQHVTDAIVARASSGVMSRAMLARPSTLIRSACPDARDRLELVAAICPQSHFQRLARQPPGGRFRRAYRAGFLWQCG